MALQLKIAAWRRRWSREPPLAQRQLLVLRVKRQEGWAHLLGEHLLYWEDWLGARLLCHRLLIVCSILCTTTEDIQHAALKTSLGSVSPTNHMQDKMGMWQSMP